MTSERVIPKITALASGRFEVDLSADRRGQLCSLASELIPDRGVVRLRRSRAEPAGWRTLLITGAQGREAIRAANRWAADVRDALIEPEAADLYLFLWAPGIGEQMCAAIEADDKFCRRFVNRPNETDEKMLARTFLAPVGAIAEAVAISEPLSAALARTAVNNTWLDERVRDDWRKALISGQTGADLADLLAGAVPAMPGAH